MTIVFNTLARTMIIASMMIAVLVCEHVINEETSDGYTHTKGVSCVLYNQLFRVVRDFYTYLKVNYLYLNYFYKKRLYSLFYLY